MKKLVLPLLIIFLLSMNCEKNENLISILYFTDAHEIAPVNDEYGNRGGVARLKTIVDQIKSNNEAFLVFGGDLAGGTLFGGIYKGFPMVEAFNQIPLQIANFGQHDFDFGVDNTIKLIQNSKFTWLTSNIKDSEGNNFYKLPDHIIFDTLGIKVGFIGLMDAIETSVQDDRIRQIDLIDAAKKTTEILTNKGVDYIIAITQTTFSTNEALLEKVAAIDVILTEEISENRTNMLYVGSKPIISTCGNMGSVAEIKLQKAGNKIMPSIWIYPLDTTIKEDPALTKLQKKYVDKLEKDLSTVLSIAKADFLLQGSRQRENALANLVADSFRDYYQADIALMNGGGLRANILKGNVTLKNAYAVLPFGNTICLVNIKGNEIINLLKAGMVNMPKQGGDFLQVSGLSYSFNFKVDGQPQITSVEVNGKPIEPDKSYKVALSNFILFGNGDFDPIPLDRLIFPVKKSPKDVEVLIKFLTKNPTITPHLHKRINVLKG
ncbi:MAG: bifunctional UDP-sugar hydrolase/5'-nucleotidase [Haliscomenobacter sp.]|uniref:bifunctional metallophosphatase/5'-nucleotidase n=1 Tax=Haliscomenobacter sp. TaxID=2717303 RepID=UPI0029A41180|nr:bifunctional UDP-sugar hydrolase/5'-nucleotidase [Haliscomenobacter sp.]MDX2070852.1 bifunctional UDP-sugar hydrolase/5'-nucleotidase [Haliscomenobacter sp.]